MTHGSISSGVVLVRQGVAGLGVAELRDGDDVAGEALRHGAQGLAQRARQRADALVDVVVLVTAVEREVPGHVDRRVATTAVPDAAFIIAGEGELRPSLQTLAGELGGARTSTSSADVTMSLCSCTRRASVYSARRRKALRTPFLNTWPPVCQSVATDVGGVREAIVEGETGLIVPSGDDQQMAERIIQTLWRITQTPTISAGARLLSRNSRVRTICAIPSNFIEELLTKHSVGSKTARLRFPADSRV